MKFSQQHQRCSSTTPTPPAAGQKHLGFAQRYCRWPTDTSAARLCIEPTRGLLPRARPPTPMCGCPESATMIRPQNQRFRTESEQSGCRIRPDIVPHFRLASSRRQDGGCREFDMSVSRPMNRQGNKCWEINTAFSARLFSDELDLRHYYQLYRRAL